MTNPYQPPENGANAASEFASSTEHSSSKPNQRGFRYRVVPSTLCLLVGVPLICMSVFWGYQIWATTISSDLDLAFRLIPPILFVGMAISGVSLIVGSRNWMRGNWKIAVASTMIGWGFVYGAYRIAAFLVPDAA